MKDFEKTIAFVRNFNAFGEDTRLLWHNDKYKHHPDRISVLIADMEACYKETIARGAELTDEVKDVCPDVLGLKQYVCTWENLLGDLCTVWMDDDDFFNVELWETKIGDYFQAHEIVSLVKQMEDNYRDIKSSLRSLKNSYGLSDTFHTDYTAGLPADECHVQAIPHDVLRLFGQSKDKYQEFIAACKDQCPKEIARLYKKHGTIQLSKENGIVTTLYEHLYRVGLLTCSKRNFQQHYSQV